MIGFILALLYLGYRTFVEGSRVEAGFVDTTSFLYYWYWVWGGITFAFVAATMLGLTAGTGFAGSTMGRSPLGRLLGGLGGMAVGGGFSLPILFLTALRLALPICGAWLLMTAGTPAMSFAQFDVTRLVVGGIMLAVHLFMGKSSVSVTRTTTTTYGDVRTRSLRRGR